MGDPSTIESSTISVPAESEQVTIVRQFVRLACHRYGCDGVADNILLVTDELVANAMAHASPEQEATVEVGIIPTQGGVRIEVHDHVHADGAIGVVGDGGSPHEQGEHRGLQIVSTLASEWGVADESDGKVVWAEIARSGTDPSGRTQT